MSMAWLPEELLEPIVLASIQPGTSGGAQVLLVCSVFHRLGRSKLYERVNLASQQAFESYFILGSRSLWPASTYLQREHDYRCLRHLVLSFGPYRKLPFALSSHSSFPPHGMRFPNLATLHLNLAQGVDSYLHSRPKPLSRRISKLLGDFSPQTLILARESSAEVSLASVLPHHLRLTQVLYLASHHISHLVRLTPEVCPVLERVVVEPYPAVRVRDLAMLGFGLKGSGVTIEVVWEERGKETWWDREMEADVEIEVEQAQLRREAWAEGVSFRYREGQPGLHQEERD